MEGASRLDSTSQDRLLTMEKQIKEHADSSSMQTPCCILDVSELIVGRHPRQPFGRPFRGHDRECQLNMDYFIEGCQGVWFIWTLCVPINKRKGWLAIRRRGQVIM